MRLLKRFAALALAVACLAMLAVPAGAKTFTDLETHWAKSYMEDLNDRGYLTGYPDGTMRPDEKITACETLALLSRFYQPTKDEAAYLYEDYGVLVEEKVPANQSWAYDEIALCLAAGIVTEKELGQLDLSLPIAKEYLGVCIIRAMQLVDEAKAFKKELTFEDKDSVASSYASYIALLVDLGVVTGDTNNKFNPRSGVTRAVCATMISRALEYNEKEERTLVLPKYDGMERYEAVVSGISANTATVCGFDGLEREYVITYDTEISLNGKSASLSSLAQGDYAAVTVNNQGLAELKAERQDGEKWVWGKILRLSTGKITHTLYLTDAPSGKEASYAVSPTLPVSLNGTDSNYTALTRDRFAVLKLKNNALEKIYVAGEKQEVRGKISQLSFGSTVVLKLDGDKGADYSFTFDILELPAVKRGSADITIDRLRAGDQVLVQLTGSVVNLITAEGTMSTVTGELTAVTSTASGTFWTVRDESGSEKMLTLDQGATATENGKTVELSTISVGDKVTVSAYDDVILTVVLDSTAATANKVEGKVLAVDTASRKVTILSGSKLIYVKMSVGTAITSAQTGNKLTITTLPTGSQIAAYGSYTDATNFTAVSVIVDG